MAMPGVMEMHTHIAARRRLAGDPPFRARGRIVYEGDCVALAQSLDLLHRPYLGDGAASASTIEKV